MRGGRSIPVARRVRDACKEPVEAAVSDALFACATAGRQGGRQNGGQKKRNAEGTVICVRSRVARLVILMVGLWINTCMYLEVQPALMRPTPYPRLLDTIRFEDIDHARFAASIRPCSHPPWGR